MRITVGIPSYNEERSIRTLLEVLENQESDEQHMITEVIVSDDSTDATPYIVNDFARNSSLDITLMHHNNRRGAASAWNEIFANAIGDVIVLFDADVIPKQNTTMLLASRLKDDVALCAANPLPLPQEGIAAKATAFNALWLRRVRKERLSQYTVMGRALSIRSGIAKTIKLPDIVAIDLYLQCKVLELGYKVDYCDEAQIWFKPAGTMLDFTSQVVRAVDGHEQIKDYFDQFNISLPSSVMFRTALKEVMGNPKGTLALIGAYLALPFYRSRIGKLGKGGSWRMADSTKGIKVEEVPER